MKLLHAAALAASTLLIPAMGTAAPAQQMSTVPELTCRSALDGSAFLEIEREDAPPCCYVTEELAWYQENDVLLNRFYEKEGPVVYYTVDQCRLDVDGVGLVAGNQGVDDTTTGSIPDPDTGTEVPPEVPTEGPGNPGNQKPNGGAGETPNGGPGWNEPNAGLGESGQGD